MAHACPRRLQLEPRQNQQFRQFMRVCRTSLVAIKGYGHPMLTESLSLFHDRPALLDALFAIASQVDDYRSTGDAVALLEPYHRVLRDMQSLLGDHRQNPRDFREVRLACALSALVLLLLSMSSTNSDWEYHASHLVHLINSSNVDVLKETPLGLALIMLAAHMDIAAFAIGRTVVPTCAWSRWHLDEQHDAFAVPFQIHEINTGVPASLLSIISKLDQCASLSESCRGTLGHSSAVLTTERERLWMLLEAWQPQSLPESMLSHQRSALRIARRTLHRAAMLFHARVYGFHANLLDPLDHLSETTGASLVEEIVTGIRHLLHDFKDNANPIGNAMAWPLAVAGSECGSESNKFLQHEVVSLIHDMADSFYMLHLTPLEQLLRNLWEKHTLMLSTGLTGRLSLESIATETNTIILCL
ncbi:hypothetical protein BU24DRAFT_453221 [Aaosphaeria arxii CBS 175.79]|uniref:Transcription factor domain-containing protein n=1 Tax=Aaosphaeria arxii CBS 175.79 TaxID=1450172 RepID=A0A6A5XKU3_9PLEO|nr:uncharacterized protein BU24DRAFT_453221 [Aaosphaeria arxii CBS 175.79]KAF2012914.1 hypothetical protein BU24DRAFT_453221 [Aaosphaeria arxii CBS 175.79]